MEVRQGTVNLWTRNFNSLWIPKIRRLMWKRSMISRGRQDLKNGWKGSVWSASGSSSLKGCFGSLWLLLLITGLNSSDRLHVWIMKGAIRLIAYCAFFLFCDFVPAASRKWRIVRQWSFRRSYRTILLQKDRRSYSTGTRAQSLSASGPTTFCWCCDRCNSLFAIPRRSEKCSAR